jgi:outer membrane protein TolC
MPIFTIFVKPQPHSLGKDASMTICARTWRRPALWLLSFGLAGWLPALRAGDAPPAPPPAPAARKVTLEEAKQLALNNKALTLARLNVQEKEHGITAASKDYFPKLLGSYTFLHFDNPLGQVTIANTGVHGILPVGTIFKSVAVVNQNAPLGIVMGAQPITKLIAVNAAVQIARADTAAAQAQLDKGTQDLVSGVAQAFQGLLGAQRIQAALELQIKGLDQLVRLKPLPQLKVGLVEARQGLQQVRAQVQELTVQLNDLLNLPACTVLELVDPIPPGLPVRCADDAAQQALAGSPEVREAEQNIVKAEAALKVARMAYLPDVNVVGGYADQKFADYIQHNIGFVGVTANFTVFEWGKKKDVVRQRQALIAVASQNLAVVMDRVQLEARKAYGAFEAAREAFGLAGEMVQARKEAEKVAAGEAKLIEAKSDTAKAELEQMKAEIAYRVAHAKLAGLLGQP